MYYITIDWFLTNTQIQPTNKQSMKETTTNYSITQPHIASHTNKNINMCTQLYINNQFIADD